MRVFPSPRSWFLLSLCAFAGGCGSSGPYVDGRAYVAKQPAPEPRTELVRVGDRLTVRVFGEDPLSIGGARVRAGGTITLPLLGEYGVAGKKPADIAKELEKQLAPFVTSPHVSVTIDQSQVVITVIGEANSNGRLEMDWPLTLIQALAQAGGLTEFADESAIYVLRGTERIRFDYDDIIRGEKYTRDFLLQNGDVIVLE